jgi:hypothetical protein
MDALTKVHNRIKALEGSLQVRKTGTVWGLGK